MMTVKRLGEGRRALRAPRPAGPCLLHPRESTGPAAGLTGSPPALARRPRPSSRAAPDAVSEPLFLVWFLVAGKRGDAGQEVWERVGLHPNGSRQVLGSEGMCFKREEVNPYNSRYYVTTSFFCPQACEIAEGRTSSQTWLCPLLAAWLDEVI